MNSDFIYFLHRLDYEILINFYTDNWWLYRILNAYLWRFLSFLDKHLHWPFKSRKTWVFFKRLLRLVECNVHWMQSTRYVVKIVFVRYEELSCLWKQKLVCAIASWIGLLGLNPYLNENVTISWNIFWIRQYGKQECTRVNVIIFPI